MSNCRICKWNGGKSPQYDWDGKSLKIPLQDELIAQTGLTGGDWIRWGYNTLIESVYTLVDFIQTNITSPLRNGLSPICNSPLYNQFALNDICDFINQIDDFLLSLTDTLSVTGGSNPVGLTAIVVLIEAGNKVEEIKQGIRDIKTAITPIDFPGKVTIIDLCNKALIELSKISNFIDSAISIINCVITPSCLAVTWISILADLYGLFITRDLSYIDLCSFSQITQSTVYDIFGNNISPTIAVFLTGILQLAHASVCDCVADPSCFNGYPPGNDFPPPPNCNELEDACNGECDPNVWVKQPLPDRNTIITTNSIGVGFGSSLIGNTAAVYSWVDLSGSFITPQDIALAWEAWALAEPETENDIISLNGRTSNDPNDVWQGLSAEYISESTETVATILNYSINPDGGATSTTSSATIPEVVFVDGMDGLSVPLTHEPNWWTSCPVWYSEISSLESSSISYGIPNPNYPQQGTTPFNDKFSFFLTTGANEVVYWVAGCTKKTVFPCLQLQQSGLCDDCFGNFNNPDLGGDDMAGCCEDVLTILGDVIDRLSTIQSQIGDFPVVVPTSLIGDGKGTQPGNTDIRSLTEMWEWYITNFDAVLGEFPIPITIEDSDPSTPGNQTKNIAFPNIAEALAEIFTTSFTSTYNSAISNDLITRLIDISIKNLSMDRSTFDYVKALVEYSDFQGRDIERSIDIPVTIRDSNGNAIDNIDDFRKDSNVKTAGFEFVGNDSLQSQLKKVVFAAYIIKNVFSLKAEPGQPVDGESIIDANDPVKLTKDLNDYLNTLNDPNSQRWKNPTGQTTVIPQITKVGDGVVVPFEN